MDETYIKVKGEWRYLYRAVDKEGNTVVFLLTKRRQRISAHKFLIKAIADNGRPELISIDKSDANSSAINYIIGEIVHALRQDNANTSIIIVEQDHRIIK